MAKIINENSNNKLRDIQVVVLNNPTKEQAKQKIKELSDFLSKTWHIPIKSK